MLDTLQGLACLDSVVVEVTLEVLGLRVLHVVVGEDGVKDGSA